MTLLFCYWVRAYSSAWVSLYWLCLQLRERRWKNNQTDLSLKRESLTMPRQKSKMTQEEKKVATFLTDLGIWWDFEQPIYVKDEKERPRLWTPDFYLPELGVFVEVCGADRRDYSYRQEIYEKNKISVIFVHTYKHDKWQGHLISKIREIHEKRWELIRGLE